MIYECTKFNRRDQKAGESVEQYISALYELVESCEYRELKDKMLRDRIVVGIRDFSLSEHLQMDTNLTLDKAIRAVRQKEAVHEQTISLQGDGSKKNLVVVYKLRGRHKQKQHAVGVRMSVILPLNTYNVHVVGVRNTHRQTSVLHRKPFVTSATGKGITVLCVYQKQLPQLLKKRLPWMMLT